VVAHRTLLDRTHAILPAVAGDEIATRIAHRGDPQLTHQLEHVGAEALLVGRGMLRLIDADVHSAAKLYDAASEGASHHGGEAEGGVQGEGEGAGHRVWAFQQHRWRAVTKNRLNSGPRAGAHTDL